MLPRVIRIALVLAIVVGFLVCLFAIVVRGPIVIPPQRIEVEADISAERLRDDVLLLSTSLSPRDYEHVENLDRAAQWIAGEMEGAGLEIETQEYRLEPGTYRNVIAHRDGTQQDSGAVIIGAHYDAFDEFPGADDNASGVAVLLELVRTLPRDAPLHDQYFVAFSTEEPPFFRTEDMGSAHFARKLVAEGVNVRLMVSLDMVGYYSERPHSQRFPIRGLGLIYPDTGDFVAVVGDMGAGRWLKEVKRGMLRARTIPVHSFRAPTSLGVVDLSDHLPFRKLGLPGVQVTDTSFMRHPHYHGEDDTPDLLDYRRMSYLVRALHTLLLDMDEGLSNARGLGRSGADVP
ncbi:MAG: M28 family peptidase [bacterium]|nr:M28 family peptidase [bacterium]